MYALSAGFPTCILLLLLTFYCPFSTFRLLHSTFIPFFVSPQIQLPSSGLDNSSSDSSDFSSEDDSTVVLMKMRSRSPSPRRSKHGSHHSLSGSDSPEQAKKKALNVADGSPSSTTTVESDSTGRPVEGSSAQASAPQEEVTDTGDSGL